MNIILDNLLVSKPVMTFYEHASQKGSPLQTEKDTQEKALVQRTSSHFKDVKCRGCCYSLQGL